MMKSVIAGVIGAIMVLAGFTGFNAAGEARYGKQKVVYHINYDGGEGGKAYYGALRNIQNHIDAVGKDDIDVKIVLHGDGVDLLKQAKDDLKFQGNVTNLKTQNVAFNVCSNTLTGRKIDKDKDLFEVYDDV